MNFTVKDSSAVNEELLRSAAENAKRKAEILCIASGVKLGNIVSIDYNWGELNVYSQTRFNMEEYCMMENCCPTASIDLEPDDINVNDTVTFVWQID